MRFKFTSVEQHVVFGPGAVADLGDHLDAEAVALLCTSRTYTRDGTVARLRNALGRRLVAVFDEVRQHVPDSSVDVVLESAAPRVDTVIGLGGGSALGTAKAVAVALGDRRTSNGPTGNRPVSVIAVPTTYAGSEMTPIYGVTRVAERRKITATDRRALPALVLYDPELTLTLPPDLTAGSGINALAHCVEGAYSATRSPISTATAVAGIEKISRSLPRCVANGRDLAARAELLSGAFLAGSTLAHAGMAVHHGLCHVLGGTAGVPHGVANGVVLPHAMRFNLPVCAEQLATVARSFGLDTSGLSDESAASAAIDAVALLVSSIGLPTRLRDAGVPADDLPRLSSLAFGSAAIRANPRPITEPAQIEEILRAAW